MEGPSIRRYLRLPLVEKVRVKSKRGRFTIRPRNGDLSMGGVFIDGRTLPVGTEVEIVIEARRPIRAKGRVCFIVSPAVRAKAPKSRAGRRSTSAGAGRPAEARRAKAGMGIEFTELSEADLQRLEDLVARIPWP